MGTGPDIVAFQTTSGGGLAFHKIGHPEKEELSRKVPFSVSGAGSLEVFVQTRDESNTRFKAAS
jgi:hypothetical protein